ncbi:hypothetical protein G6F65_021541 [Rhizopus arrhizus]|nr:hypothetical protein G6F65_021541 [Rhizopus arrhizus]
MAYRLGRVGRHEQLAVGGLRDLDFTFDVFPLADKAGRRLRVDGVQEPQAVIHAGGDLFERRAARKRFGIDPVAHAQEIALVGSQRFGRIGVKLAAHRVVLLRDGRILAAQHGISAKGLFDRRGGFGAVK